MLAEGERIVTSNTLPLSSTLSWLLSCAALLSACGGRQLSVGDNDGSGAAGSDLCNGGTWNGDVSTFRQTEIDKLAGCERINGNLQIRSFPEEGLSLAALSSLREVHGNVLIERVPSLAGLEALEQVGNLQLSEIGDTDLSALHSLRRIEFTAAGWSPGGTINIQGSHNLKSLAGLEQLEAWNSLSLIDSPELATVAGIAGPTVLSSINLGNLPALRDLGGLDFVFQVDTLDLHDTGVTSLGSELDLYDAGSITIDHNPALTSLAGFGSLSSVESLRLNDNDSLIAVDLPRLQQAQTISITNNDVLEHIPAYQGDAVGGLAFGDDSASGLNFVYPSQTLYEVGGNARLLDVAAPDSFGQVQQISIWGNPALSNVNLNNLQQANGLEVRDNPVLRRVIAPALTRVGDLEVVDNPALSTADFVSVKTFSRTMSGNGDPLAPPAP
jgi:hypothetical protein